MHGRRPALWRIARILRIVGLVVLVLIIVFVATAVYFAVHTKPQFPHHGGAVTLIGANSTVEYALALNVSNPGPYQITGVALSTEFRLPPNGTLIAHGGSPTLTIGSGATTAVHVEVWVSLNAGGDVLLTHNVQLQEAYWANATFASLFTLHFNDTGNLSWGAPFYQFNATPGTPTPEPNGTVQVPVSIFWQDSASFGESGSARVTVLSATHQTCGTTDLPVSVNGGSSENLQATFYAASSCNPSGGTVDVTFTGQGMVLQLPPEAIP